MINKLNRSLKISLGLLVIASSLACMILPAIGVKHYFTAFQMPYSSSVYFDLLVWQLIGPTFTLLLSSLFVTRVIIHKHLAWWLWLTVLVGPIYTAYAVGGLSHDFSHAVFKQCSGVYGDWINGFCILGGASLILLSILSCYWSCQFPKAMSMVEESANRHHESK